MNDLQNLLFKLKKIASPYYKNLWIVSLGSYSLWILTGMFYYKYIENWKYSTAFYYAIEAGLSIGFCDPTEKTDPSRLFTVFYVLLGSSVIVGSLGGLGNELLGEKKARIVEREHYLILDLTNINGIPGFLGLIWYNFKILCGWYKYRRAMIFFMALSSWMTIAIIWAMSYLNWSFIKALYFAVTTLSTGGLQGPPCIDGTGDSQKCEFGDVAAVVTGVYGMVGVPLYFLTLGTFAGGIIEHSIKARHKAKLYSPIEAKDFIYATKLLSDEHSNTLSLGEFVLLELMRLGATDRKQIERIRIKFQELDIKKNNVLDYDELCQGGYLIQSKSHAHFLSRTKSGTEIVHLSNDISSPFHDHINDNNDNTNGVSMPSHYLPTSPSPKQDETDEQALREEVQEEIQRMQRARSASIAKIDAADLLFFDDLRARSYSNANNPQTIKEDANGENEQDGIPYI